MWCDANVDTDDDYTRRVNKDDDDDNVDDGDDKWPDLDYYIGFSSDNIMTMSMMMKRVMSTKHLLGSE